MTIKQRKAPRQESRQVSPQQSRNLSPQQSPQLREGRAKHLGSSSRIMIPRPAIELEDQDIARLVIEAMCCIDTVKRWAAGYGHRNTRLRLERACAKLGIERKPKEAKPRRIVETAA